MLQSEKTKIILIYFLTAIAIIIGLGIFFALQMSSIQDIIYTSGGQISAVIADTQARIKVVLICAIGAIALVNIAIAIYLAKYVIYPKNKFIESAEKVLPQETVEKEKKYKRKSEVKKIDDILTIMTKELNEKLREVSTQKNQIETILLHMTDGIIAFNMEGEIILVNPAAKNLLSIRPEDAKFEDIFKRYKLDINLEKIIYLENWTSTEQRIQVEDKYINVFFAPFKNEEDRPSGVIAVIQDITEHVQLDEMRKEFVADVSHELKTPITSIMGYADTLLEGEYDKETQNKFLEVIAGEARRMARLVTDLLTLSRYDSKNKSTEKTQFDLGELVKQCQDKLAIEIMKKKHDVNCFVTADVPPVYANRDDIERVVLNILTNSIKYTKEGGEIKIYVGFVYNDAYIKIFDNGIGIPEEDLNKIFERFYRVDKARTREMGGTGLGLSIAKEILDKNGGSIDIKSTVGKGTEVVVRIPTKNTDK